MHADFLYSIQWFLIIKCPRHQEKPVSRIVLRYAQTGVYCRMVNSGVERSGEVTQYLGQINLSRI